MCLSHETFEERALDSGHLEVSLWALLSGDQWALCGGFAERSVHSDWGLKRGWAQRQGPYPPYSHSSTSLIGFVY